MNAGPSFAIGPSGNFGPIPITTSGYVGVGVAPIAASGDVRGTNTFSLKIRNSTNTADLPIVSMIGPAAAVIGGAAWSQINIATSNTTVILAGYVQVLNSTLVAFGSPIFRLDNAGGVSAIIWTVNPAGLSGPTIQPTVTAYTDSHATKLVAGPAASRSTSAQSAAVGLGGDGGDYTISAGAKDGAGRIGRVILPGGQLREFRNVGAVDYVVDATGPDWTIFQDATAAARTITLPPAATHPGRVLHYVVDLGAVGSTGTVLPTGADTIDGAGSVVLSGAGRQRATFQSSGVADWVRIA